MSVRILNEQDVHRLLPMAACIAAMEEALAALARGEVFNPLRFVVRPPGEPNLLGLMPAHRAGREPVFALKAICIAPGNAALGLDLHQGFVALFDGATGVPRAIMNASAAMSVPRASASAARRSSPSKTRAETRCS